VLIYLLTIVVNSQLLFNVLEAVTILLRLQLQFIIYSQKKANRIACNFLSFTLFIHDYEKKKKSISLRRRIGELLKSICFQVPDSTE
jgi:hypothetical protein